MQGFPQATLMRAISSIASFAPTNLVKSILFLTFQMFYVVCIKAPQSSSLSCLVALQEASHQSSNVSSSG
jgi:hypothetical protein